jgi:putative membrane protein
MHPSKRWLRAIILLIFSLYLIVWPGSTILLMLDRVPSWGEWLGGLFLIIPGLLVWLWLVLNYGGRGGLAGLAILAGAWAVEHIGTTTGFPFGAYSYTERLQPQIVEEVPIAIPFAWVLVVPSALLLADRLLGASRQKPWSRLVLVVLLTVGLDLTLEPVIVYANRYWEWHDGGWYYGVPLSNFLGWGGSSLVLGAALVLISAWRTSELELTWLPIALYLLNLLLFFLVNLAYSFWLASAIALVLLLVLVFGGRLWELFPRPAWLVRS